MRTLHLSHVQLSNVALHCLTDLGPEDAERSREVPTIMLLTLKSLKLVELPLVSAAPIWGRGQRGIQSHLFEPYQDLVMYFKPRLANYS